MTRRALFFALGLALSAPALAQRGPPGGDGGPGRSYANPSAGIAADLELARLTGEKKGRGFALRETAAPDAVMFVPQMVLAQGWLKDHVPPSVPLRLRPHRAWASCDGALIVTSGARQDGATRGWYTTVWQRQTDGTLRWVFAHDGPLPAALEEPEMIEARVAQCPPRPAAAPSPPASTTGKRVRPAKPAKAPPIVLDPAGRRGRSRDGSLTWEVTVDAAGAHHFTASMRQEGEMRVFRDEKVAAPGS